MSSQELANKDGEVDTENCPVVEIDSKTYQTYIFPGFGLIRSCGLHIQYGNEIKDSPKKHFWFDIPSPEKGEKPKVTKIVIEDRSSLSAELLKGFDDYISKYTNDQTPREVLTGLNMGTDFKVLNKEGSEYRKVESALPQASTTTENEDAADTSVESENSKHQFYKLSALVGTDKEGSIDVLKFHGPVEMNAVPLQNMSQIDLDDSKILNKDSLARVLCRPILEKLGTAEETKEMFNLSDNSRKLKEMKKKQADEDNTRGTKHLQAKKDALKASLDALLGKKEKEEKEGHKERITHFTKKNSDNKFGFELLEDKRLQDSITNYETIKTNLEESNPVLQDLPDDLSLKIYEKLNGSDKPMVLEGDTLYKFYDAIQRKVDGLNNVLKKVNHFKQDEEGTMVVEQSLNFNTPTKTLPLSDSVLNEKERKKYYFNASSLEGFGKISDLSVKERASDLARNTSILRRKFRQGVENTSIQGIGKAASKAASKGVGKAKGFMSYFSSTKKKLDGSAEVPAEGTAAPANTTGGGKRKTRKNKARKTRRKVQRKRRQSKKH
jgi:hypothetical protein